MVPKERKLDMASYEILQELNAVIDGVYHSFSQPVARSTAVEFLGSLIDQNHELLKQVGYEGSAEQFKQSVMEGNSSTLPLGALEAALADVKLLRQDARKSPAYVRDALESYAGILQGLLGVKEATLSKATGALMSFSNLHGFCDKLGSRYMQSQAPNACRPAIYGAAAEVRQLKEHIQFMSSLENQDAVKQLEGIASALETFQKMCGACPFRKFYQQNKPKGE